MLCNTIQAQYEGGSGRQEAFGSSVILQLNDGQVAEASQLIYTTNPDPTFAIHQTINTLNLEYRTANGQIAFFETGNVVLTFQTNPGSATLLGTTTSTPINGLVSFSGLGVSNTASGYELLASGAGVTSAISSDFDIVQGGAGFGYFAGGSGRQEAMADGPATGTLSGQVFWVGGGGSSPTAWNDPLNWFPNTAVPSTSARLAMEPNNNGHNPILDQNRTVFSFNFNGANKKIVLGNFNLTPTGALDGANANNFVQTNGTGSLKRSILNSSSFTFPVGNSTYNPVSISNRTGTADDFSVRVLDEVYYNGLTGGVSASPRVKRTWNIDKLNPTANAGNGVDFTFNWNSNEVSSPAPSNYSLYHYDANGNAWGQVLTGQIDPNFNSANNSMIWTGYKGTFSPFGIGDQNTPLPIKLLYFTAECNPQGSRVLRWATASEINSDYFELQSSDDMLHWTNLKTIPALGFHSSTYQYPEVVDSKPSQTTKYYRLKQVDLDGEYTYFQTIAAHCPLSATSVSLYPNPTAEDLHIQGAQTGVSWEILDMTGRRIRTGTINDRPLQSISILGLPAGIYRLKLPTISFPFIIQ